MAEFDPIDTNPQLASAMAREGIVAEKAEDTGPSYRMVGTSKIPVSKHLGKLWSSRLDQARTARKDAESAWSEAIRYYENDQSAHRTESDGDVSGTRAAARLGGRGQTSTENVVFANTTTMLPILYAKNPTIEVTPTSDVNKDWSAAAELLINKLFWMQTAPGVAMKGIARRGVLWAMLTNSAYSKVGWTSKEDSGEQALEDLRKISMKYENAKTAKEIMIAEGELKALEDKISLLTPAGPTAKLVSPFKLFVDPTSTKPDHSDAGWIMEEDWLPTHYLNAVYGRNTDGKIVSVYEPTHVLNASTASNSNTQIEDDVNNFSLFSNESDTEQQASKYGYKTGYAFEKAQYTKCFWVWDKTTRRLLLYASNKWEWPLWVWDDPLKLQEFYPYDHLWFHESVEGSQPKGEVTYYLDQQDSINDNNTVIAQAREWAKNNIIYNKNVISNPTDVEKFLKGPNGTAVGADIPEGMKISDIIFSAQPPAMAYPELLNNGPANEFINRVTGIMGAQQGAQFKTNTTNDAINFYQKNVDIRVDEKIDCIEDWIGKIGWKLLQLAAQHWEVEDVAELIDPEVAKGWKRVGSVDELRKNLSIRVVGGSTDKPTSKNKKNQALEMTQIMGQFAGSVPAVAIVMLKILERAFKDDITITEGDWQLIMQSMQDSANAAGAGPGGAAGGAEGDPAAGGTQQDQVIQEQIDKVIKSLPPELQGVLQGLLDEGVPPQQAVEQVAAQAQQQQQPA
jgi:hypothetical protein